MKYVMSWKRKRHGTQGEHDEAQRRALALMRDWQRPDGMTIHQFVMRAGEPGGFAVFETDDLTAVHQATAAFAGFNFHIDAVIDMDRALAANGVALAWRDTTG